MQQTQGRSTAFIQQKQNIPSSSVFFRKSAVGRQIYKAERPHRYRSSQALKAVSQAEPKAEAGPEPLQEVSLWFSLSSGRYTKLLLMHEELCHDTITCQQKVCFPPVLVLIENFGRAIKVLQVQLECCLRLNICRLLGMLWLQTQTSCCMMSRMRLSLSS